jgi:hypothetical protein
MASYNYYVSSFAAIDTTRNTIWRPMLEHIKRCGGNVAIGNFVNFFQVIVCSHGGPDDAKRDHDRSRFTIHAWFIQYLLYSEDDDGEASVKVNLYTRNSELTDGVRLIGMPILPKGLLLVQTNLLYNLSLRKIRSMALVYHFQKFKHGHHRKLNVFAIQQKLECVEAVLSPVSVTSHKASSDGIHVDCKKYESLPVLMRPDIKFIGINPVQGGPFAVANKFVPCFCSPRGLENVEG